MKPFLPCLFALMLLMQPGCQRGPQNSVKGEKGEELTLSLPDSIVITQGDKNKFSVTVTRKKLEEPVDVKLENLPKGVSLADGKFTFTNDTDSQFVTLEAKTDAEPTKDAQVQVTASSGEYTAVSTLRVTVQQSLENKAAAKKAFGDAIEARLDKVKGQLEEAEKTVKTLPDENQRAALLKQISDRYEALADARGNYEKMLATPVEVWEREKVTVEQAATGIETSTQALVTQMKAAK